MDTLGFAAVYSCVTSSSAGFKLIAAETVRSVLLCGGLPAKAAPTTNSSTSTRASAHREVRVISQILLTPSLGNFPIYCLSDQANLFHELRELIGIERLHAVGQRAFGVRVDLDNQPVCASGDGCARHRCNFVPATGAMRRIGDDGQV